MDLLERTIKEIDIHFLLALSLIFGCLKLLIAFYQRNAFHHCAQILYYLGLGLKWQSLLFQYCRKIQYLTGCNGVCRKNFSDLGQYRIHIPA